MRPEELDKLIKDAEIKSYEAILELHKLLNLKNTLTIKQENTHD